MLLCYWCYWPCDLWPLNLQTLLPVGWVILVFLGRFVLDLLANICQTRHVTLRPSPLTLEVMALVADTGLSCSVCVPSLNFLCLPVRKILGIYCASINPPGNLDLWPLNPKTVSLLVFPKTIFYSKFEHFGIIRFRVMLRTNRLTRKSNPRRPTANDKTHCNNS